MINFSRLNGAKKAGVTIEVMLSGLLAVAVLFLVLGAFNDNLQEMAAASGFNNVVNKTSAIEIDSAEAGNYADSQMNVTIVAEQGLTSLADAATKAASQIAAIRQTPPPLPVAQQMNLAKWLTIYGLSTEATSGVNPRSAINNAFPGVAASYGISVNPTSQITTITTATGDYDVSWYNANTSLNYTSRTQENRVKVVNDINNGIYFAAIHQEPVVTPPEPVVPPPTVVTPPTTGGGTTTTPTTPVTPPAVEGDPDTPISTRPPRELLPYQ